MAERSGRPGAPSALREQNRRRVIHALEAHGDLTQADLARETGLATATVSNIVRALIGEGTVATDSSRARRTVHLVRAAGHVVGIDHGHRHVRVAVGDLSHTILAETRAELAIGVTAEEGLAVASSLLTDVLQRAGVDRSTVVGAGMGLPAPIERATGRVGSPSILPGWVGVDASAVATRALGLPVTVKVGNDANLGALAERRWGAGIGVTDMAYLKLSEGVGAGLIINGDVFSGMTGTAGEIGHTTTDEFGDVCRCGNRGCLETLVSAGRVSRLLEPTLGRRATIAEIADQARLGQRACVRVLEDVGRLVGRALADLCNVFNPELILVGGELAQASPVLIPAIRGVVDRCGVPSATASLQIVPAKLGERTHILGAFALAVEGIPAPTFTS
nr:ROK family transcriptional regulator [Tsukamurella sp. 1534]